MRTAPISLEDSINDNIKAFCLEICTEFEQYSINAAQDFIPYCKVKDVVDLGCGDGASYKPFREAGFKWFGVDINKEKLSSLPDDSYICMDFLTYLATCEDESIENIFCHHALEHFVYPNLVMLEISRVLKPGGACYIAVPSFGVLYSVHHVVFESVDEIIPHKLKVLVKRSDQSQDYPQFISITKK